MKHTTLSQAAPSSPSYSSPSPHKHTTTSPSKSPTIKEKDLSCRQKNLFLKIHMPRQLSAWNRQHSDSSTLHHPLTSKSFGWKLGAFFSQPMTARSSLVTITYKLEHNSKLHPYLDLVKGSPRASEFKMGSGLSSIGTGEMRSIEGQACKHMATSLSICRSRAAKTCFT